MARCSYFWAEVRRRLLSAANKLLKAIGRTGPVERPSNSLIAHARICSTSVLKRKCAYTSTETSNAGICNTSVLKHNCTSKFSEIANAGTYITSVLKRNCSYNSLEPQMLVLTAPVFKHNFRTNSMTLHMLVSARNSWDKV